MDCADLEFRSNVTVEDGDDGEDEAVQLPGASEGFNQVVDKKSKKRQQAEERKQAQLAKAAEQALYNNRRPGENEALKRAEMVQKKDLANLDPGILFQLSTPEQTSGYYLFTSRNKFVPLALNVANGLPAFIAYHLEEPDSSRESEIIRKWLGAAELSSLRRRNLVWDPDLMCSRPATDHRSLTVDNNMDWLEFGRDVLDQTAGFLAIDMEMADVGDFDDGATVAGALDELRAAEDRLDQMFQEVTFYGDENARLEREKAAMEKEKAALAARVKELEAQQAADSRVTRSQRSGKSTRADRGGDGFGDNFDTRTDKATRVVFQNVNGLPGSPMDPKQGQLRDWLREARVDLALLAEVNLFWPAIPEGRRWNDRMREVDRQGHFSSVASNGHSGPCSNCQSLQYGGCLASAFGRVAHGAKESGVDSSGLGRFAWVIIQGKKLPSGADEREVEVEERRSKDLVIVVSAYRPNPPGEGMNTVWIQQREHLMSIGWYEDPREAFINDLIKEVVSWSSKGYEVIIGIDANEDLSAQGPLSLRQRMRIVGLEESILSRHKHGAPATYQRRSTPLPIDGIFASPGVRVLAGGYLGFQEGCPSDHPCLWIDIDLKATLGGFTPTKGHSPRRLTVQDQRVVDRYVRLAEQEYLRLQIPERLGQLVRLYSEQGQRMTPRQQKSFNDARRMAERHCRKLYMGGVPYSPQSQQIRDRILLFDLLLKVDKGQKVSSRKIRRLLQKTGETSAWELSSEELEEHLHVARSDYKTLKSTPLARQLRSKFLLQRREWARKRKHASLKCWTRAERMQRMRQREETRRRKKAQGKGYSGGLQAISVERRGPNGSSQLVTVSVPSVVEEGCMRENQSRYDQTRAPFSTPPMREPLYTMFTGSHAHDNSLALMEGRLPLPTVGHATQAFLSQCRFPSHFTPLDLSVSVSDHIDFWAKNPENKGSEPHGLHNGHFKAGIKSDLLAQCDTIMRDIPLQTGFSPSQWQNLMNFSIEKKPGGFRVSKMRTIQLMNSELQANNKKVGKAAMEFAEEHGLIPAGQCGARKEHEAMALVYLEEMCLGPSPPTASSSGLDLQ